MKLCCFFFSKNLTEQHFNGQEYLEKNSFTVGNIFTVFILIFSIVLDLNFNNFYSPRKCVLILLQLLDDNNKF